MALSIAATFPAWATPSEEKIMREKSAREEAAARPFDEFYRLMFVPARPYGEYGFVTKLYLTLQNGSLEASGWVTMKVRFAGLGFAERSRALTEAEVARVWRIFYEEEIFSLPKKQREAPFNYAKHIRDGATIVFSHFDKRTRHVEEVIRAGHDSQPAGRALTDLGKQFDDLVKKLDKADPLKR
jgi:hypothetical protein